MFGYYHLVLTYDHSFEAYINYFGIEHVYTLITLLIERLHSIYSTLVSYKSQRKQDQDLL